MDLDPKVVRDRVSFEHLTPFFLKKNLSLLKNKVPFLHELSTYSLQSEKDKEG